MCPLYIPGQENTLGGLVAFEEHQGVATTWWVLAGSLPAAATVPVRTQGQGTALRRTLSLCFCFCASFQPTLPTQAKAHQSNISKSRHSKEVLFLLPPKTLLSSIPL